MSDPKNLAELLTSFSQRHTGHRRELLGAMVSLAEASLDNENRARKKKLKGDALMAGRTRR